MKLYWLKFKIWLVRKLGGRPNKMLHGKELYNDITCGEVGNRYLMKNFSKEDLIDIICCEIHVYQTQPMYSSTDWLTTYLILDTERKRLKQLLKSTYYNDKELNRALHMSDLESKNERLRHEVRNMQVKAEEFNRLLYATGYIVNCTGCWPGRPDKAEELTEDKVKTVEHLSMRLRSWWQNNKKKVENAKI